MNNRVFAPKAAPNICINDHVFELKLSEIDIAQLAFDTRAYCLETLKKNPLASEDLISIGRRVEQAINSICGENAMRTMVGNSVVRIREAVELLKIVEEEACAAYASELLEKYE